MGLDTRYLNNNKKVVLLKFWVLSGHPPERADYDEIHYLTTARKSYLISEIMVVNMFADWMMKHTCTRRVLRGSYMGMVMVQPRSITMVDMVPS